MSTVSKWVMAAIVAAIILAMLRKPAATVGITLGVGSELTALFGAFSGAGDKSKAGQTGNFSVGTTKIALK